MASTRQDRPTCGVRNACCNCEIVGGSSKWSARLAWLDVCLLVSGFALLLVLPLNIGGDGVDRHEAMESLLDGNLPHEPFSLVMPVLALPLDVVGRIVGSEGAEYRLNHLLFGLSLIAIWLLLRRRAPGDLVRSVLLLIVYGSLFPPAVVSFAGETTTATLVGVGLLAVVVSDRRTVRAAGWAAVVIGVTNTPALVPALAAVVVFLALTRRTLWPFLALAAAIGLTLVDIRLHTGGFASPYEGDRGFQTVLPTSGQPGFSYPALFGVLAIVFSLGRGLLFYTPGLFLPVHHALDQAQGLRRTRALWLVVVVCMVAVYCRWWAWYGGGDYFGPRFFLFASLPASVALAARLRTAYSSLVACTLTLLALALTIWVGIVGAIDPDTPGICLSDKYALEHLCWYTPEFSALWRPVIDRPSLSTSSAVFALLALVAFVRLAAPLVAVIFARVRAESGRAVHALRDGPIW